LKKLENNSGFLEGKNAKVKIFLDLEKSILGKLY